MAGRAQPIGVRGSGGRRTGVAIAATGAALGVAAAAYNHMASRRAERLHPPSGNFIRVGDVRLHVVERGRGDPILLLHGNGATSADFLASGLVDRLTRTSRVIVPDRPGYGYSDRPRNQSWTPEAQAELMLGLMARLGIEAPVVVGHSWGSLVAAAMALAAPERVRGLVLLSGYYFPTARADVVLMSGPAVPVVGDLMVQTVSPFLARALMPAFLRRVFQPLPIDPRFRARFPLEMTVRPSQLRASAEESAFMVPAARRLSGRYETIEHPVVIMAGEGDRIADIGRQSIRLHRVIPTSALAVVPGAGHMIHYAAADAIARAAESLAEGAR